MTKPNIWNKDKNKNKTLLFFNLGKSAISRAWLCGDRSRSFVADYSKSNQGYVGS